MNRRTLAIVVVVVVCGLALVMTMARRKVSARSGPPSQTCLQPVPAWHPPVRFESRAGSGSTRGGFDRKAERLHAGIRYSPGL